MFSSGTRTSPPTHWFAKPAHYLSITAGWRGPETRTDYKPEPNEQVCHPAPSPLPARLAAKRSEPGRTMLSRANALPLTGADSVRCSRNLLLVSVGKQTGPRDSKRDTCGFFLPGLCRKHISLCPIFLLRHVTVAANGKVIRSVT